MTEQQKPKVTRTTGARKDFKYWSVDYGDQGHTVLTDPTTSADELRAIADKMEEYELDDLHQVWQNEAQQAWRTPGNNASAPVWYVTGFLAAKEIDYRERVGLPQKGESHVD